MGNSKEKINNGCVKIFKLLSLLYDDKADYKSVVDIFKDETDDQTKNNLQVVLNKNLNALKIFGITLNKKNHKYILNKSKLFSMNFDLEDIKALSLLKSGSKDFPDEECRKNIEELIHNIMLRMDNEAKNALSNLTQNYNFAFYYSDMREQIDLCKNACNSNVQYEITYLKNKKQIKCRCNPKEMIYGSKTAYLKIYDPVKAVNIEVPLNNILELNPLHQVKNNIEMPMTVVFKVKNRLAKSYKLKENEHVRNEEPDGSKVIVNTSEPIDKLKSRLLRYNANCEVISPKYLRNEMLDIINDTLHNYE